VQTIERIDRPGSKHLYDIEVSSGQYVQVEANTRAQAASIAGKHGYTVRSVNMIG
jgi:hypothetical protein